VPPDARQAFVRETELLFESVVREDRPVLTLFDADYTFVNERLARHYGIAQVYGPDFRRSEVVVGTITEKLLMYAIGREITHADMPVVRSIFAAGGARGLPIPCIDPRDRAKRATPECEHYGRLNA
jgi:hypothetical protein